MKDSMTGLGLSAKGKHDTKVYDVVICGGGVVGVLTAILLTEAGLRVALVEKQSQLGVTFANGLNTLWPSPNDLVTRLEVAHGSEMAQYLCDFHVAGQNLFREKFFKYVRTDGVNTFHSFEAPSFRQANGEFEKNELQSAVKKYGYQNHNDQWFTEKSPAIVFDGSLLRMALQRKVIESTSVVFNDAVVDVKESVSDVTLTLSSGASLKGEIVVLCTNAGIGNFVSSLREVFVPMSDSLAVFEGRFDWQGNAIALRSANGHLAASLSKKSAHSTQLRISGPRFLLPRAGAGLELDSNFTDINPLQVKMVKHFLSVVIPSISKLIEKEGLEKLQFKSFSLGVDCHPCDEMPVIGEVGRHGRLLCAGGWLASGYAAGAQVATILSELVRTGKSHNLHERLSPRRLMTV